MLFNKKQNENQSQALKKLLDNIENGEYKKRHSKYDFGFTRSEWEEIFSGCVFTDEELLLIDYKCRGWENLQIAEKLRPYIISETTVKRLTKKLYHKIMIC